MWKYRWSDRERAERFRSGEACCSRCCPGTGASGEYLPCAAINAGVSGNCSAEVLRDVDAVIGGDTHPDAFFSPVGRQNVLSVARTVHPALNGRPGDLLHGAPFVVDSSIHSPHRCIQIVQGDIFRTQIERRTDLDGTGVAGLPIPVGKIAAFRGLMAEVSSAGHVAAVAACDAGKHIVPNKRCKAVLLPVLIDQHMDLLFEAGSADLRSLWAGLAVVAGDRSGRNAGKRGQGTGKKDDGMGPAPHAYREGRRAGTITSILPARHVSCGAVWRRGMQGRCCGSP